jgi:hypothetical protein
MLIAMDKATVRSVNGFGQMFVEVSNISKAGVNPYRGNEIPRHAELGLDPDKVYRLLRCPAELAKAVDTFNGLPLLDRHVPVTAEKPSQDRIVGSLGTDATFDEPFLRNSLAVWTAGAIAGIKTKQLRELSCAYSYEADMTPGVYEGVAYDGIMRNIRGNHVALVEVGRAGPECVVGDSKLLEKPKMSGKKLTANASLVIGAIAATLTPVLAQDAQIGDLTAIAAGIKGPLSAKDKQTIIASVTEQYGDKLAQDATLDALPAVLDALVLAEDEAAPPAKKTEVACDKATLMAGGLAEDEADMIIAKRGKTPPTQKDDTVEKPAMDAAIAAAQATTKAETVAMMQAIRNAENKVRPIIGELAIAQDSAAAVFKLALDSAKVKTDGVPEAAYEPMVDMLLAHRANGTPAARVVIAQDSAISAATGLSKRFPNALKLKGGV